MKHPYRGMSLTGAPAARFPKYLWAKRFNAYDDVDENGHAPETLDCGASEHDAGCNTGWIDYTDCYIIDGDKRVMGFAKQTATWQRRKSCRAKLGDTVKTGLRTHASAMSSTTRTNASPLVSRTPSTRNLRPTKPQRSEPRVAPASGDWYSLQDDGGDALAKH